MDSVSYYKAIIAYDGTQYKGWQAQKEGHAVVDCINRCVSPLFNNNLHLVGASRTDAGVHAQGQVARVCLPHWHSPERLCKIINDHLPADISFQSLALCSPGFHPRIGALSKTYQYDLSFVRPSPFRTRFTTHYPYPCNYELFVESLQYFIGEHDFLAFSTRCGDKNTVRAVDVCFAQRLKEDESIIRITIKGKSFLHHMIRRMVGAALTVGSQGFSPLLIKKVLQEKKSSYPLLNAPAKGLTLMEIRY